MMQKDKHDAGIARKVNLGGRPPALKPEHVTVLRAIVFEMPHATLGELAAELQRRSAVHACEATIRRCLRAQGIVRLIPKRQNFEAPASARSPKRYGYTAAHRRSTGLPYSTDVTDAEWALVADLFERPAGQRGTPARYERRGLVNACCYVLRTGCAWRLLPSSFAPWQAVYKAFVRWTELDAFEQMHDRLRQQWRLRMGRHAHPSAAVIDAQATRSSPQGGEAGFDVAKRSKVASATSWWTRSGCCWQLP
jgi:transposase